MHDGDPLRQQKGIHAEREETKKGNRKKDKSLPVIKSLYANKHHQGCCQFQSTRFRRSHRRSTHTNGIDPDYCHRPFVTDVVITDLSSLSMRNIRLGGIGLLLVSTQGINKLE